LGTFSAPVSTSSVNVGGSADAAPSRMARLFFLFFFFKREKQSGRSFCLN